MYRVISIERSKEIGLIEKPRYIKRGTQSAFVQTTKEDACGVAVNGDPYNLFGHSEIEGADTVLLVETDAARVIAEQNKAVEEQQVISDIAFVVMAEAGNIDDVTATEHLNSFAEWAYPVKYEVGNIRKYGNALYRCISGHTSQADWSPDVSVSLWVRIGDPTVEYPEWSKPIGAHDAYAKGDKVSHNEQKWFSEYDANVWEPGVFGWKEVIEE